MRIGMSETSWSIVGGQSGNRQFHIHVHRSKTTRESNHRSHRNRRSHHSCPIGNTRLGPDQSTTGNNVSGAPKKFDTIASHTTASDISCIERVGDNKGVRPAKGTVRNGVPLERRCS